MINFLCAMLAFTVGFFIQFLNGPDWASFIGYILTFLILEMRFSRECDK